MDSVKKTKTLILPCQLDSSGQLRWILSSLAYDYGFSEDEQDSIVIASGEALANIFEHAYRDTPAPPPLEILISTNDDSFTVDLFDEGISFDFSNYKMPEFPQHYIDGNERGAGVYIIHKCMDEVKYDRLPNERNRTRMVKRRHPARETADLSPTS